ncbi:hypothetical protein ACN47E_006639 [Coniothyrium glycines]
MARAARSTPAGIHHCAICGRSFAQRLDYGHHMAAHDDAKPAVHTCSRCRLNFADGLALEKHQIQFNHVAPSLAAVNLLPVAHAPVEAPHTAIHCERCKQDFHSKRKFKAHKAFPNGSCADYKLAPQKKGPMVKKLQYMDPDNPYGATNGLLQYDNATDISDITNRSNGGKFCYNCGQDFVSLAGFNNHLLGCTAKRRMPAASAPRPAQPYSSLTPSLVSQNGHAMTSVQVVPALQTVSASLGGPPPMQHVQLESNQRMDENLSKLAPQVSPAKSASHPSAANSVLNTPGPGHSDFSCEIGGCGRVFLSDPGLRNHQKDAHGVGGQALDIHGNDSWMLNQQMREQLRAKGLLRPQSNSARGGHGRRSMLPARPTGPSAIISQPLVTAKKSLPLIARPPLNQAGHRPHKPMHTLHQAPSNIHTQHTPRPASGAMPTSVNMGGVREMEEAKHVQGKILRLLIQSDIFIHHDGKMRVSGIDWTRIGTAKQQDVVGLFDRMCHLPRIVQNEYLPTPKAFKDEYEVSFPAPEFKTSPDRDSAKPGLGVVALTCSKIVLADGCQDVVKVAAVDVITSRVLMNHLVCTSSQVQVNDWRSRMTGLSSWDDLEGARQAGYKVFKGWSAVRSALWKFIDKDTIIVGHNLRADLDCLRMIHGRAVDVVKVVEKAANGPLSKAQLGLDSLSHDYPGADLTTDPDYGRDTMMNAFAIRELGLWFCKNQEQLARIAKQKSSDFQRVVRPVRITPEEGVN